MKHLHICSWRKRAASGQQSLTQANLLEQLEPAAEVTDMARTRLVLRILARCPVAFPLREYIDPTALVSWLTNAGAVVVLLTPVPIKPSVPVPLPLP